MAAQGMHSLFAETRFVLAYETFGIYDTGRGESEAVSGTAMKTDEIYLDNAATTRVHPEVFEAMRPYFCDAYANAATLYAPGVQAGRALEEARAAVASLIGASDPAEIVFTSGATESINWAIRSVLEGTGGKPHAVTSAIEHHAVLHPLEWLAKEGRIDLTVLPADETGLVSPDALREALRPETALVSIMHANNEIGTVEPVAELAALAREAGALFHADICQTVGKIPLDVQALGADLASLSAHKFHGPKGVGALYIRKGVRLPPLLRGGGQEKNRRAGTSNVPGIVGLRKAAELAAAKMEAEGPRQRDLVERLWAGLSDALPKIRRNGHPDKRIPGLLSVCVEGAEGEAILLRMDMYGIRVSSGSACTTGSLDPSHVLLAIGLPAEIAHGSVRFSMSAETTEADVDRVLETMPKVVEGLRAMSPTWKG